MNRPDTSSTPLPPEEILRYGRHLTLGEVGMEGQQRLRASSVLVVGAGGLGSPAALYLAAAGVGRIGLVDFDRVELTNLQRQVLYTTGDVDRPKVDVAVERLRALNPHVEIDAHASRLDAGNARALIADHDVVLDGTDNFATRYLVNDACVLAGKPNVYGSIFRFEGQVSVFWAGHGPCYRCLFPHPPDAGSVPNCAEGGVLGVLPGTIGSLQATETLKLLLGRGEPLIGRLLIFDALAMQFRELKLPRDPDCPVCGPRATIRSLEETPAACGREEPAVNPIPQMTVDRLARRMRSGDLPDVLLDVRNPPEWEIGRIEGARLLPLGEFATRADELDPASEIVVYCHRGGRSARAVAWLRARGFTRAINLAGGIDAWSLEVDPAVPRY